jgi:hypothetical protein
VTSIRSDFDELMRRVVAGREFAHASFEPIYYLVFHPRDILEVRRHIPGWAARLRNDGWKVDTFSVAEEINQILADSPMRKIWLEADRAHPLDWKKTNDSLANTLVKRGTLQTRLEDRLSALEGEDKTILLVRDLEALHPYLRIGAIEAQLQGKFHVPTVFFYPGVRAGKTQLRFLGFYPEDGNYRSVHVGG